jgi:hypothetical protein
MLPAVAITGRESAARSTRTAAISSGHVTATYLYCIVKSTGQPSTARVPAGLPGAARPSALAVTRSVWLIAAAVPLATYGPEPLERHIADLDWVGRIALAHERVVEHFAGRAGATVIPMKLFTMFSNPDRAVADIRKRKDVISATMRRIAGAEEWGIRIMRGAAAVPTAIPTRAASGAAFLAVKKQLRDDARAASLAAAEAAAGAFEHLASIARDARRRDDVPAAGALPPLLDAAFLVPASSRARFKSAAAREAARCTQAGAQMTLSGPWPAYNFVQGDDSR